MPLSHVPILWLDTVSRGSNSGAQGNMRGMIGDNSTTQQQNKNLKC